MLCKCDTGKRLFHSLGPPRARKNLDPLAISLPLLLSSLGLSDAGVAQLVEHLICNQRVGGSIPSASSTRNWQGSEAEQILAGKINGLVSFDTSPFCVSIRSARDLLEKVLRDKQLASEAFSRDGWVSG